MNQITVREYARLTTESVDPSLDRAQVSVSAFDWICRLNASSRAAGATLVQFEGRRELRLDSYVGVVETPCGTRLEILPKHMEGGDCVKGGRELLRRMLRTVLDLPSRVVDEANLELFDAPLSEWVMRQFLFALDHLVKRGVRFDYRRVEEEQHFLRGQLDIGRQLRQPPGRQHLFQIRHDLFQPDRPENRLLKLALERVCASTRQPDNWRLGHELRHLFADLPASTDVKADFRRWGRDRLMAHYQPVKPWCELILGQHMPQSIAGQWRGISLLFPMEKLFERYVVAMLQRQLQPGAVLKPQARSQFLCEQEGSSMFQLQPDILLEKNGRRWVVDTKWKRIDAGDRANNYGISQADLYQLYAYGQKYLAGDGELALVYPRWSKLDFALAPFRFSPTSTLWVLPFDLQASVLVDVELTSLPLQLQPIVKPNSRLGE